MILVNQDRFCLCSDRWVSWWREASVAGIITISPGHDASYPWRQIGTAAQAERAGQPGGRYYLSPAEKGGEPPGRWRGNGLADVRKAFPILRVNRYEPAAPFILNMAKTHKCLVQG